MPVGAEAKMSGTTLCPNCNTRFKITEEQRKAHHGMVRCGYCLQAFDAQPGYTPNKPHPQMELPIEDLSSPLLDTEPLTPRPAEPEPPAQIEHRTDLPEQIADLPEPTAELAPQESAHDDHLPTVVPAEPVALPEQTESEEVVKPAAQQPTLAEQILMVPDEDELRSKSPPKYQKRLRSVALFLLLLALLAQAAYFYRVELAARLPVLKPALIGYCRLLGCNVPLPQKANLMSIESSDLEADPAHENQILLNVLLRNRAPYAQAYPSLEFTLNDTQDKPLARRIFKPADYLPPLESEMTGLLSNHELGVKLHVNIGDLRPTGYRLVLFYP